MRKGLVLGMVLLLLATAWVPLASAQGAGTGASVGELSPFGRGYVENLILWSGAGVNLVQAPSFGGNASMLAARLGELSMAVNGTMPANATPIVLPFASADPGYSGPAPLNHSAVWSWNLTGVDPTVDMGAVGTTMMAESELALDMLHGSHDGDMGVNADEAGKGVLLLLAATEAVSYMATLGWNGTAMVALNLSDPNMTDIDPSNGHWLPAGSVTGTLNRTATPWSWEPSAATPATFDSTVQVLRGLGRLYMNLVRNQGTHLVGADAPFPNETRDALAAFTAAVYWNLIGLYYDARLDIFHDGPDGTDTITAEQLGRLYIALRDIAYSYSESPVGANAKVRMYVVERAMLGLQYDSGGFRTGYTIGPDGYMLTDAVAPIDDQAWGIMALYAADVWNQGVAYGAAARGCLRDLDIKNWNATLGLYLADPKDTTPTINTSDEVAVLEALVLAVDIGFVELAKYRVSQLWAGMERAGLQLSETDTTGENYTAAGNDTDGDGILKHSVVRGEGRPDGVAPVLALGASFNNTTGNWTVLQGAVGTATLMEAAYTFVRVDRSVADEIDHPTMSEEHARMLLHFTDAEMAEWMEGKEAEVAGLQAQVATLQGEVASAAAEAAALRANVTKLLLDLNESRENVTVLNASANWLRAKLEQTNGTVDNLTKEIEVLSDKISRLERNLTYKGENVTKLEVQLRAERNNVTQLQWKLNNATADLTDAQRDLKVAQEQATKARDDMTDQEDRAALVGMVAFLAGLFAAILIMYLVRRSK